MDMVARHLYEAPPRLTAAMPDAPHALDEVLAQMLDKDPTRRPTLVKVREVLAEIARPSYRDHTQPEIRMPVHVTSPRVIIPETTGRTPERRRKRIGPVVVVLASMIAIVGGMITFVVVKEMRKPAAGPVAVAPAPAALPAPAPALAPALAPTPAPAVVPDPPAVPTTGTLVVQLPGSMRGVAIVDGERHPTGSRWELVLAPGPHELEVRVKGYATWSQRVEVTAAAEPRMIDVALDRRRRSGAPRGPDGAATATDDDDDELIAPKGPR